MSNTSVAKRIREAVECFERGEMALLDLHARLESGVGALEGVDRAVQSRLAESLNGIERIAFCVPKERHRERVAPVLREVEAQLRRVGEPE
jgi:hypothetical protein